MRFWSPTPDPTRHSQIVARLGCRIIRREYIDSGNFKNWAIPTAPHEWVFLLDANERITSTLRDEIRRLLDAATQECLHVYRANHFLGHPIRYTTWGRDNVIRLFRRDVAATGNTPTTPKSTCRAASRPVTAMADSLHLLASRPVPRKLHHYADQQAELWYQPGPTPESAAVDRPRAAAVPAELSLERGFRDGLPGFQFCTLTGFYSFLKQAHSLAKVVRSLSRLGCLSCRSRSKALSVPVHHRHSS